MTPEAIAKELYEALILWRTYDANDHEDGMQLMIDYAKAIHETHRAIAAYEQSITEPLEE